MGTPMQSGARHRVRGSICLLGSLPALVAVQWKPAKQAAVRNTLIPGSCANVLHITFTQTRSRLQPSAPQYAARRRGVRMRTHSHFRVAEHSSTQQLARRLLWRTRRTSTTLIATKKERKPRDSRGISSSGPCCSVRTLFTPSAAMADAAS